MRRIYFLVPDVPTTKRVIDDLLLARIEERHLHVLADVPRDRVEEIEAKIRQHLPSVEIEGTEPRIPAFP